MAAIRRPLTIGLIGYGAIGRVHALGYRAIPFHYDLDEEKIKIVAVATSNQTTAKHAARQIGCELFFSDYRQLIARNDIDIIDCCLPNYLHEDVILRAADNGKHIYCEKPLACTVEEGARMLSAVESAGVTSQISFNFRFFPAITRARQLVEEGFLGRIFSFKARYNRASYIDSERPISWRLSRKKAGGGALYDLGSHVLDMVGFLLGKFSAVQAHLETLITERPTKSFSSERATVDVDDLAFLHLKTETGIPGIVEVSRLSTGAVNDIQLEIFGERGALRFRGEQPSWLEIYDTNNPDEPLGGKRGFQRIETVQRYQGQKAPDWTQTAGFARSHAESQYRFMCALWEDRKALPDISTGLHVQEVMEAAEISSDIGRWVKVGERGAKTLLNL